MTHEDQMKLFFENKYLISDVMKKYKNINISIDDVEEVGTCGLLKAADTFEDSEYIDFKPYALFYIKSAINKYIQDNK